MASPFDAGTFHAILDSFDHGLVLVDGHGETAADLRFTYMSDQIRTFGIDPASRIGRSRLEIAADAVEDPTKWAAHVATMTRREPFRDFEYKMSLDDGSTRYLSISGKPVFDEQGGFLGYRGSAMEISERVFAAQRLNDAK